jgi:crotonobetainyl-CoA:carnitine CoA-transferase CaiB-like acyl-CoA transferase
MGEKADNRIQERIAQIEAQIHILQEELSRLQQGHESIEELATGDPPLKGIRILDLTWAVFGPYGTQMLADMGAEVIKVERPGTGDIGRGSGSFYSTNRNKKSIAVDLKTEQGRAIILKLAKTSHVFVQNFRAGVIEKLGLGYKALQAVNPRIIYCSLSGYGEEGPYQDRPGQDLILQGMSGVMSITGMPEAPTTPVGFYLCDVIGAFHCAQSILLGLLVQRERGIGQKIELALLNCAMAMQPFPLTWFLNNPDHPPPKAGRGHWTQRPLYQVFRTKDKEITINGSLPQFWSNFCQIPEFQDLATDSRFATREARIAHKEELAAVVESRLLQKTRKEWLAILAKADVLAGPVYTYAELLQDPQVLANQMVVELKDTDGKIIKGLGLPIRLEKTPGQIQTPPPALGMHTQTILTELGYSATEIQSLCETGVIQIA